VNEHKIENSVTFRPVQCSEHWGVDGGGVPCLVEKKLAEDNNFNWCRYFDFNVYRQISRYGTVLRMCIRGI